eukprot:SAG31_NODE_947_length_10828_cov_3.713953_1_plen_169_part_00
MITLYQKISSCLSRRSCRGRSRPVADRYRDTAVRCSALHCSLYLIFAVVSVVSGPQKCHRPRRPSLSPLAAVGVPSATVGFVGSAGVVTVGCAVAEAAGADGLRSVVAAGVSAVAGSVAVPVVAAAAPASGVAAAGVPGRAPGPSVGSAGSWAASWGAGSTSRILQGY